MRKKDTHAHFMYIVHIHVEKLKRTRNKNKNKISTRANDNYSEGFFPLVLSLSLFLVRWVHNTGMSVRTYSALEECGMAQQTDKRIVVKEIK